MAFRRIVVLGISVVLLTGMYSLGNTQEYPDRPIHLIVPFAPGGGGDAVARIVAQGVGPALGQPVVVENRAGAAAIVGTDAVARAKPDGYTLLLGQSGPISINPGIYKNLPYDAVNSFTPITLTTSYPYILVVSSKLPVNSVQDLVSLGRKMPFALNYGSAGTGSANHLVTEMFDSLAGIQAVHVPYRGTLPAVIDLMGGQVRFVFSDPISALANVKAGTLRVLAVTSQNRSPIAPEVPTIAESGFPGFDAIGWHGILAPAGTPAPIINRLHAEIVKVLEQPETRALLLAQALQPVGNTPQEFAAFIKLDINKWADVAKRAGIAAE
jgi:putative tricarboxylic transport membrane protein